MPETEEYFVVSEQRIDSLVKSRISWAFDVLLASGGMAIPFVVNAVGYWVESSKLGWGFYLNSVGAAIGLSLTIAFWILAARQGGEFDGQIKKIKAGVKWAHQGGKLTLSAKPLKDGANESGEEGEIASRSAQ